MKEKNSPQDPQKLRRQINDARDYAQDAAAKIPLENDQKNLLKDAYPSNSFSKKEENQEKEEPRKVEKVVQGRVITRKKGLGKRFMETFITDDITNVRSYILQDVLIPAAKDTIMDISQGIMDAIKTGIEVALLGEARRSTRGRRDDKRPYVSYNSYSSSSRRDDRRDDRREPPSKPKRTLDDIAFASRGDAEEVLDKLVDLVIDYGQATVADLYDLVGITGEFTDNDYGWEDLSRVKTVRVRDGYVLNLPKPIPLR